MNLFPEHLFACIIMPEHLFVKHKMNKCLHFFKNVLFYSQMKKYTFLKFPKNNAMHWIFDDFYT